MTEVLVKVCNSSDQFMPVIVAEAEKHGPGGFIHMPRGIISWMVLFLLCARHVVPPVFIFLAMRKLWDMYVTSCRDVTCRLPLPPGNGGLPFLGETLQMILFSKSFFERKRRQYGDVFRTHMFGQPTIRVVGAENVKHVLRGENTLVATQWPESTRSLLGEGSLAHAIGENHVAKKRTVMKLFSFEALSSYVPVIQEVTQKYVRRWIAQGRILGCQEFKTLNFDLTCRLLLGLEMDEKECERLRKIFDIFTTNIFSLPVDVYGSGYRKGKLAREELLRKIDEIIQERQERQLAEKSDALTLMLSLCEEDGLTVDEVKNIFLELLFAGHGTTSSAESYLVYILSKHPDVQQKIEAEMASNGFFKADSYDEFDKLDLSLQHLNKMAYINNVVKEVLRVSPPVGGGYRKALRTFEVNGFQVPKGWSVLYGIRDTQVSNEYFDNCQAFDPDRWNTSGITESQFKYLPFGGGRRRCAGKDLARIMLKIFAFELVRGCNWQLENPQTTFSTFPMPFAEDDLPLRMSQKS